RRNGISKPPTSAPIEPQDPQRRGRRRDGQHIAETEGKTQVRTVHEQAPTARFGGHHEQRLWPDKPFAQAVATAAAVVRLPHQILQLARTQRQDTATSGTNGGSGTGSRGNPQTRAALRLTDGPKL